MAEETLRWWVGVDWAWATHQVCVLDATGRVVAEREVAHSGTGLAELGEWLCRVTAAAPATIGVAIEVPHGPVVESLLAQGFAVHAINPKQLDRFRDRFTVAGAKDDRRDARVQAEALRTEPAALRRLRAEPATLLELREWSRLREELIHEHGALLNRLREQLRRYYPQALALTDDLTAAWYWALLERAPTPAAAATLRPATVTRLLRRYRVRRLDAATVLSTLQAPALRVSPGTVAAASAHVGLLLARLRLLRAQLATCETRLVALCDALAVPDPARRAAGEQSDVTILRSLPGVAEVIIAALLAEAAHIVAERDYHTLRALSGVAPVTRRSGTRHMVTMRAACNHRLRDAVRHWAHNACLHDPVAARLYATLRARGHSQARALRSVADRLLAVACAMLRDRTLYDPARRERLVA
jgi:transposase